MIVYYSHDFGNNKGESHKLLEQAIGHYLGDEKTAERLVAGMRTSGEFGKPVIDGFDHFSISHSGKTWAVLFDSSECGLDIQYCRACDRTGIAERFFSETESAVVRTAESNGPETGIEVFFAIWTRREALIKALGLSVAMTDLPPVNAPSVAAGGRRWYFGSFNIPGSTGLAVAICTTRLTERITVTELRKKDSNTGNNNKTMAGRIRSNSRKKNGGRYASADADSRRSKGAVYDAYAYISSRMRTVYEVRKHLADRGYSGDEIQEAVNELIGHRYLDDYEYAVRYFEHNREKRRGSARAERELAERGVDRETISNAREDFMYNNHVDEFSDALGFAMRELEIASDDGYGEESGAGAVTEKQIASIARKLESRGFSHGDIYRVLDRIRKIGMDRDDD